MKESEEIQLPWSPALKIAINLVDWESTQTRLVIGFYYIKA